MRVLVSDGATRSLRLAPKSVAAFYAEFRAAIANVLNEFRSGFVGKSSPVHFFWGSFDLSVTRFSGRRSPPMPNADIVTREAYSHEVSSVGWWPGDETTPYPAFYAYASPEPDGFGKAPVRPAAAFCDNDASQFRLRYDDVRLAIRHAVSCSTSARAPTRPLPTSRAGTARNCKRRGPRPPGVRR